MVDLTHGHKNSTDLSPSSGSFPMTSASWPPPPNQGAAPLTRNSLLMHCQMYDKAGIYWCWIAIDTTSVMATSSSRRSPLLQTTTSTHCRMIIKFMYLIVQSLKNVMCVPWYFEAYIYKITPWLKTSACANLTINHNVLPSNAWIIIQWTWSSPWNSWTLISAHASPCIQPTFIS